MFQAALTLHDIDADSAMGTSIITDDRSSCRFSDDEEVSECVYVYHNATIGHLPSTYKWLPRR